MAAASLALTSIGAVMVLALWARWMRPVADNLVIVAMLLGFGLFVSVVAFLRGDRSWACKAALTTSALLLGLGMFMFLAVNRALNDIQ